jgi:hypothetical protein
LDNSSATTKSNKNIWKDPTTGYIWQTNNGTKYYKWQEGVDYCRNLNLAGISGWELPTINDLRTILYKNKVTNSKGYKHYMPKELADGFGKYSWLWSSSADVSQGANEKYIIRYHAGRELWDNAIKGTRYVRCVYKGKQETQSKSNNIWEDPTTKLIWQNQPYTADEKKAYDYKRGFEKVGNWQRAKKYCQNLYLDGFDDWRLPTYRELLSIVDTQNKSKNGYSYYIKQPFIDNMPPVDGKRNFAWFWSITEAGTKGGREYAGDVYFYYDGKGYRDNKEMPGYIRCVR